VREANLVVGESVNSVLCCCELCVAHLQRQQECQTKRKEVESYRERTENVTTKSRGENASSDLALKIGDTGNPRATAIPSCCPPYLKKDNLTYKMQPKLVTLLGSRLSEQLQRRA